MNRRTVARVAALLAALGLVQGAAAQFAASSEGQGFFAAGSGKNAGKAAPALPFLSTRGPASIESTRFDFNGDQRNDLLWRNVLTGQVYRLFMDGLSKGAGGQVYTEGDVNWTIAQAADFNGDGVTDLLWRNNATGHLYMMPFNANGTPAPGSIFYYEPNLDWRVVHTPDIDGDGKADLLWWNITTGQVYAMIMNGATITAAGMVYQEADTHWKIVGVGDTLLTGKTNQLLWRNYQTGQIYLMPIQHNGGGSFTVGGALVYTEGDTTWQVAGIGDVNGDGRSDIVWRNTETGHVYLMVMEDTHIAARGVIWLEPNLDWKIVSVSDYNGDGKADILWRNEATGQVYLMLMNGFSIASGGMVYHEPDTSWRLLGSRTFKAAAGIPQP